MRDGDAQDLATLLIVEADHPGRCSPIFRVSWCSMPGGSACSPVRPVRCRLAWLWRPIGNPARLGPATRKPLAANKNLVEHLPITGLARELLASARKALAPAANDSGHRHRAPRAPVRELVPP